jgi:hypothetical protein
MTIRKQNLNPHTPEQEATQRRALEIRQTEHRRDNAHDRAAELHKINYAANNRGDTRDRRAPTTPAAAPTTRVRPPAGGR